MEALQKFSLCWPKQKLKLLWGKTKITAFLVTSDMPGFKLIESAEDKIGMRGIQSSSLEFDHMAVPAENILGQLGEGVKLFCPCLTMD